MHIKIYVNCITTAPQQKKKEDMIFKYTIYNKIPSKKLTRYMFNLDTETITFY